MSCPLRASHPAEEVRAGEGAGDVRVTGLVHDDVGDAVDPGVEASSASGRRARRYRPPRPQERAHGLYLATNARS